MKKILLINLKGHHEIISSTHLINAIIYQAPDTQISLLIYQEFNSSAAILNNVHKIYTIDRAAITALHKKLIYSKAFAYDAFFDALGPAYEESWDEIINFSNDKVSSYLSSFFLKDNHTKIHGTYFDKTGQLQYSSNWLMLLSDLMPQLPSLPIHFQNIFLQTIGRKENNSINGIAIDETNNEIAYLKFGKIRKQLANQKDNAKLIGIPCNFARPAVMKNVLQLLLNTSFTHPVLLATCQTEKEKAHLLNRHFTGQLIIIEDDFKSLPSTLLNLDLLLSTEGPIKYLADLLEIPAIEVITDYKHAFQQQTTLKGNLILTATSHQISDSVFHLNLLETLRFFFNLTTTPTISTEECLYIVERDSLGITYKRIIDSADLNFNHLFYLMARHLLGLILLNRRTIDSFFAITDKTSAQTAKWHQEEMQAVLMLSKKILSTLKSLRKVDGGAPSTSAFVSALDKLLDESDNGAHLVAFPALFFKMRLETLTANSTMTNLKNIEQLLYLFKKEIKIIIEALTELEEAISNKTNPSNNYFPNLNL
ncbi:MAG: hypothetical protein A2504_11560 [Bdellovibrionales bacterium RIFOXYD12_FULL_39_22]|nr:MAG: hypothetical protein A2385_16075 [Bdellovibrionales bacterium RIFOXYB1_FULL_39_21]OFZ44525.1 MAG: hypothetical protein A2485_06820 [Bdellovibrionales bacterium RIFOXYC12_FULL_39_17]OFZ49833.1 MAG: hypothetical protein A2404_00645 [Bdellovibrionales bacterium RIFOXYC1_FULL_39_130]OFZ71590.1 MAG: hypothetical protein A2451_01715 [Bdellovibrionales bacterium RIFOXYC2_FULL_39_8]OFZ76838.1 MAG: hypothetical protein A2560_05445 [Bdellovibrionales bacterium RIFOXYD1_FULL_39_84]OFZ95765.1 MAG: